MLWGVPPEVNRFFAPAVRNSSKPIQKALAAMVLAFLMAPHYRRLKTIAGMVSGHRVHVATISRRLNNPAWTTRDWYISCADQVLSEASRFERALGEDKRRKRKYVLAIDTTYHASVGEKMENLLAMSTRKDPRRRNTRQHVFVMGLLITECGARIPLPRRSYYTKEYCASKNKKYHTQNQLAQLMISTAPVPADADVTVVFDSAFDADLIHRACRKRGFREVFPIDPNRNLATTDAPHARAKAGAPVAASTLQWKDQEFETLELECTNEDFALFRRRHVDNFRAKKTYRKYVHAARRLSVSKLGDCLIVVSYKENPNVRLLPDQSDDWKDYRRELATRRKKDRKRPSRWTAKVLACTDPNVTAREVIQWYEIREVVPIYWTTGGRFLDRGVTTSGRRLSPSCCLRLGCRIVDAPWRLST